MDQTAGLTNTSCQLSCYASCHAVIQSCYYVLLSYRFLVFLGIYTGIVNNQNLSRFVRYNAMQAVLLDVLLM